MNLRTLSADTTGYFVTNRFHVVMMPAFLTFFWNQSLQLDLPLTYYLMITLTTAGGYIYNMYTDEAEDSFNYHGRYRIFGAGRTSTKMVIYACFIGGFLLSWQAGWRFVLYGGVVHFLGSLYSRPLPFKRDGRPLRIKEIPFVKNLYAGVFWSVALILTPYAFVGERPDLTAALAVLLSFLLNYFVEVMWDLRDMRGDSQAGFRTVPLVIGETRTLWLLRIVHVLTCVLFVLGAWRGGLAPGSYVMALVHLPLGLAFLQWYRGLTEKDWASHLYILYAGTLLLVAMLSNHFMVNGV